MGQINVDGFGTFEVDDSFGNLSPEQQKAEVDSMIAQVRAAQEAQGVTSSNGTPDSAASALPPPDPAQSIIKATNGSAGIPIISPLRRGLAQMEGGIADTADLVSKSAGDAVRGVINQDDLKAPTTIADLGNNLRAGNYGQAALDVPGAAIEFVPQLLGAAGAAAAGTAVGGPVGAAVGLGAYGAATQGGDLAKARAAYNGRTDPNATDALVGLGGAAALNAVPGVGPLAGLERAAEPGLAGAAGQVLKRAAADSAQAIGQQAVATAGTAQGGPLGTYDPALIAQQALVGGVTRAGSGVAMPLTDALTGRAAADRQAALSAQYAGLSPETQAEVTARAAAYRVLQGKQDDAPGRLVPVSGSVASRTAGDDITDALNAARNKLIENNAIDPASVPALDSLIKRAANSQRSLDSSDYDALGNMGLSDDAQTQLGSLIRQRDLLSDAGIAKRGDSWLSPLGAFVGKVAGAAGLGAIGHPAIGGEVGGRLGGAVTNSLATRLGLTDPPLVKAGKQAEAMLQAAGLPLPDSKAQMFAAIDNSRNAIATQAVQMGMNPEPYIGTPAERAADAQARLIATQGDAAIRRAQGRTFMQAQQANAANDSAASLPPAQGQAPQAQTATDQDNSQAPASTMPQGGPQEAAGVAGPVAAAIARAAASKVVQDPRTGSTPMLSQFVQMPPDAAARFLSMGQGLPPAQFLLGHAVSNDLLMAGMPKPLNYAQEFATAVRQLQESGAFDKDFADNLLQHRGRLVWGLYNMVRNQMLLNHGIDRTTLDYQNAYPANAPMPMAQAAN